VVANKKKKIKVISWNVNGLRAVAKKNFFDVFKQLDADIFALQETKLQEPQLTEEMKQIDGYEAHWSRGPYPGNGF
jgi:exodeoxyribonuclease-3